jgi:hypothetical protein
MYAMGAARKSAFYGRSHAYSDKPLARRLTARKPSAGELRWNRQAALVGK